MAILSPLIDLAQICAELGVQDAILCPGSRSAALTIAFTEHPKIHCRAVQDERSAAYIALGIAQKSKKPVVLVCTSGTAALNFSPAVAEAYFLEVPLLVFTADRPVEWIHQYDGQTIFQQNIYGQHVKRAYQWQADYTNHDTQWMCKRTASEAIQHAVQEPCGPIHINIPIREPFYPETKDYPLISSCQPILWDSPSVSVSEKIKERVREIVQSGQKVLFAVGQQDNPELSGILSELAQMYPILGDSISQVKGDAFILLHDHYLGSIPTEQLVSLQPDILITTEKSFISKPFKQFVRANPPKEHWHVQIGDILKDPFQTLTWHISFPPVLFFKEFQVASKEGSNKNERYYNEWVGIEMKVKESLILYYEKSNSDILFSEADLVLSLVCSVSTEVQLHVGNSLAIRYVNLFYGLSNFPFIHCNRGTSGIDGCVSTAVGAAYASPNEQHVCLVGDISFLYDSNALWQNIFPSNLKIIVLNNQGGGIFGMIPGPVEQPSYTAFFQTGHTFQMEGIASNFRIPYVFGKSGAFTRKDLREFLENEGARILEFHSNSEENKMHGNERKTQITSLFN